MNFTGTPTHLSERLRRAFVVVAALAAFVVAESPAAADGRGSSGSSYHATCGHLGVPCVDDAEGDRKRAKRACRSAKSSRAKSRRARKACRAAKARARR